MRVALVTLSELHREDEIDWDDMPESETLGLDYDDFTATLMSITAAFTQ